MPRDAYRPPVDPNKDDVGLGEGGLLRYVETRCHLTRLAWQIGVVMLITWLPILAIGLAAESLTGRRETLLHDPAVHVRLLVATPVLLYLDRRFPAVCRFALDQLSRFGLVAPAGQARFARTVRRARRLSDWWVPEAVLAIVAIGFGAIALFGFVEVRGLAPRSGSTAAQAWYALVALPLFEFLLLRSLWRWAVWVSVLVGLSRTALDLDGTHPDCRGGLGFLRLPSLDYCALLLFAAASVLCAEWGTRFTFGATLASFVPMLLGFAAFGTLVAFGPLLLFMPKLLHVHRAGLFAMSGLAARANQQFRGRWIARNGGIPGKEDVEHLVAFSDTFRATISSYRLLLFGRRDLFVVVIATLLPVVPLMVLHIPFENWVAIAGVITGALPIP